MTRAPLPNPTRRSRRRAVSLDSALMGGGLVLTIAVVGIGFGPALDAVTRPVAHVLEACATEAPASTAQVVSPRLAD